MKRLLGLLGGLGLLLGLAGAQIGCKDKNKDKEEEKDHGHSHAKDDKSHSH